MAEASGIWGLKGPRGRWRHTYRWDPHKLARMEEPLWVGIPESGSSIKRRLEGGGRFGWRTLPHGLAVKLPCTIG